MENENPKYLNCPWCPAQAFPKRKVSMEGFQFAAVRYQCPGGHHFYIREEDTGFDYGYNYDKEEACTLMNTKDEH